jgi:RNA polymerase sigma-70 factor, ECF subfamily
MDLSRKEWTGEGHDVERLLTENYEIVAQILRSVTTDEYDAASKVFEKAYMRWDTYDPSKGSLKGWLFGIVYKFRVDLYRHGLVMEKYEADRLTDDWQGWQSVWRHSSLGDRSAEEIVFEEFQRETIVSAIASLPENYRNMAELYYQGYGYQEIADISGVPVSTVKTRLHRARMHLSQNPDLINLRTD